MSVLVGCNHNEASWDVTSSSFENRSEYLRHESHLSASDEWEPIPVARPMADVGLEERWYRNRKTAELWRLVAPDPPFRGVWEHLE